jgi:hypothetical protein
MRQFLVTLFSPGEMQFVYFLERKSGGVWRYYILVRTGRNASRLTTAHESSSITAPLRLSLPGQNPYRPRISSRAPPGPEWGRAISWSAPASTPPYLRS